MMINLLVVSVVAVAVCMGVLIKEHGVLLPVALLVSFLFMPMVAEKEIDERKERRKRQRIELRLSFDRIEDKLDLLSRRT